VRTGAPRGRGCNGAFDAMPMSGSATRGDPGNYAIWTFRTAPIIRGVCHIDVYVPDDPRITRVGGHPAFYHVFNSARASGHQLGAFDIDQPFNHGRWASRHNWRITGGALTIKLDSRGVDWSGQTRTHAHIAVSQVSLTCAP
jgi:translation initiation factor IF-2